MYFGTREITAPNTAAEYWLRNPFRTDLCFSTLDKGGPRDLYWTSPHPRPNSSSSFFCKLLKKIADIVSYDCIPFVLVFGHSPESNSWAWKVLCFSVTKFPYDLYICEKITLPAEYVKYFNEHISRSDLRYSYTNIRLSDCVIPNLAIL